MSPNVKENDPAARFAGPSPVSVADDRSIARSHYYKFDGYRQDNNSKRRKQKPSIASLHGNQYVDRYKRNARKCSCA